MRLQNVWNQALTIWGDTHTYPIPFLTCTYRSPEEQNTLYAQGRTAAGHIVTNAKAYHSPHNFNPSQAFDIGFKDIHGNIDWDATLFEKFAEIVKSIDPLTVWGGNWKSIKDKPHFETPDWKLKTVIS